MFKISVIMFSAVLLMLPLASCKKKGCTNKFAENYNSSAKKDDGTCVLPRTTALGTYSVNQTCTIAPGTSFSIGVSAASQDNQIIISNFANVGIDVTATMAIGGDITFSQTTNGILYEGTGNLADNKLSITYTACPSASAPCSNPESCTMLGSK